MTKFNFIYLTKKEVSSRTNEILPLVIEKANTIEKRKKPDNEAIQKFAEALIYAVCFPKRFVEQN